MMRRCSFLVVVVLTFGLSWAAGSDWTRFRGPLGAGVAEDAPAPLEMSPDVGFVWKRASPAGKSSPVLAGGRLFLSGFEGERLLTISLDRETGETLWTREIVRSRIDPRNDMNDPATPTPVTDSDSVFVFFPDFGVVAYSVEGEGRWKRRLGPFNSPHGMASSPLLVDGVLVLLLEQRAQGAIIGIDAATGKVLWTEPRPPSLGGSFATPVAFVSETGEMQVVVTCPFELVAYHPQTGERLWRVGGLPHQPKSSPVVAGDLILVGVQGDNARGNLAPWAKMLGDFDSDGDGALTREEVTGTLHSNFEVVDYGHDGVMDQDDYDKFVAEKSPASRLMAVAPKGQGDLTADAVLWTVDRGVPRVTTPLIYRDVVYLVRNGGIFAALDLDSGETLKEGRLVDAIDEYFASPVAAAGKILVASRGGKLTWIEAGSQWKILRVNDLGEECFATPALASDGVFVRTAGSIYRFAAAGSAPKPLGGPL